MKIAGSLALAVSTLALPAHAEFRRDIGNVAFTANGGVALTGALVDLPQINDGLHSKGDIDAYGSADVKARSSARVGVLSGGLLIV